MNDEAARAATVPTGAGARPALARAVALLHIAVVVFFTLGWALPWSLAHWLVIGGGILMLLSWTVLDGDCPLTILERWLAGIAGDGQEAEAEEQRYFVSRLLTRILGRPVSDRTGNAVVYAVLLTSISICALRLAIHSGSLSPIAP